MVRWLVSASTKWISAIVGLLLANVVAMGILIGAANAGRSHILPDYYQRAVHYNDTIDQAARNQALGWSVDAKLNDHTARVVVRDRSGVEITDAKIDVIGAARARGGHGFAGLGTRVEPGIYDLTITITRGDAMFVEHVAAEAK